MFKLQLPQEVCAAAWEVSAAGLRGHPGNRTNFQRTVHARTGATGFWEGLMLTSMALHIWFEKETKRFSPYSAVEEAERPGHAVRRKKPVVVNR